MINVAGIELSVWAPFLTNTGFARLLMPQWRPVAVVTVQKARSQY